MTLIKRDDAVKTVIRKCSPICAWQVGTQQYPDCVVAEINELPSDAVDCTDFIEWLVDRVLDETIWEYNSVAYGEIICRKLEKLGVLEVTEEPSYYIRPSADAVQGEWGHMMIDGNKLMLALSEWWYSSFGLEETEESKAIHKVMDEVERYVDHEKSADYWIPCSERLPEDSGDYLVCPSDGVIEDYSDCRDVMIIPYDADCEAFGWWTERYDPISLGFVDSDFDEFEVLAWMPLPKPYREDGEEE